MLLLLGCGALLCGQGGCFPLLLIDQVKVQYHESHREKPFGSLAMRPGQSVYMFTFTPLKKDVYSFKLRQPDSRTLGTNGSGFYIHQTIPLKCRVEFWRGQERFAVYTLESGGRYDGIGRSAGGRPEEPATAYFCDFGVLKPHPDDAELRRRALASGPTDMESWRRAHHDQVGTAQEMLQERTARQMLEMERKRVPLFEKWKGVPPSWDKPLLEMGVTYRVVLHFGDSDDFLRTFGPTTLELSPSWKYDAVHAP